MRSDKCIVSTNLTSKNRLYLERLGLLDGRTGKKRHQSTSISRFVNECITMVCESGMLTYQKVMGKEASPEQLAEAWIRFNVGIKNKEISFLQQEVNSLVKQMPIKKEYDKAIIEVNL